MLVCISEKGLVRGCARTVASMASVCDASSPLRLVTDYYCGNEKVISLSRATVVSMATQIEWRLTAFAKFPHLFAGLNGPQQDAILDKFFGTPTCCLDVDFSLKVRNKYGVKAAFLNAAALMRGMRLWSAKTKGTNVPLERCFRWSNGRWAGTSVRTLRGSSLWGRSRRF